jgi:hypothetical protein
LEAGQSGGLVVEVGDDVEEAEHFEDEFYVAAGAEEFEIALAIAERDEGADDGADAGAVELSDAFEIEEDVLGAVVDELSNIGAERIVGGTDGGAALQVEDVNVAGTPNCDLEAHSVTRPVGDVGLSQYRRVEG